MDVVSSPAVEAIGTLGMGPKDGRFGKFPVRLDSCQESSPSPSQIEVIMDWQTHAGQLFTVLLLRLRFQRLAVHTIARTAFCQPGGVTHTYARGAKMLNGLTKSIYRFSERQLVCVF